MGRRYDKDVSDAMNADPPRMVNVNMSPVWWAGHTKNIPEAEVLFKAVEAAGGIFENGYPRFVYWYFNVQIMTDRLQDLLSVPGIGWLEVYEISGES